MREDAGNIAQALAFNQPRFRPRAGHGGHGGHVESYFLRANDPHQPRALWLKATIFAPRVGSAVGELWCIVFDRDAGGIWAAKKSLPWQRCAFTSSSSSNSSDRSANIDAFSIQLADDAQFEFGAQGQGHARGELRGSGSTCRWDLRFAATGGPLAAPLSLLPSARLIDGPFPKNKLLTPYPTLRFTGSLELAGVPIAINDWIGMQGHNWGPAHAWEYAWGQCHFANAGGQPFCSVEGFTGRIRLGPWTSPQISSLVVRTHTREYRFDRLIDLWNQHANVDPDGLVWEARMRGRDGEASLRASSDMRDCACLGYYNPDGRLSYCVNSKLARMRLRVNPVGEPGFECDSAHGGALEFLRNQPNEQFTNIV